MAIIKDLYFYPIKSLRGLRTNELPVDPEGPHLDRQWMIVDESGNFVTQRTMPHLARIGVRMEDDLEIELSREDIGHCHFALGEREGGEFPVRVFKDTLPAFEVSGEVSAWLSEACGQKVKLVRISENARRPFSADFPGRNVRFVDGKPFLIISQASLKGLEDRIGRPFSAARFRANIIVEQTLPHAEDEWSGFKTGGIEFRRIKPCTRCKITTVHPLTGAVGEEPFKTLSLYRRVEKGVIFGQYYAHLNTGRLRVGDSLILSKP